jgi:hypothetical protein
MVAQLPEARDFALAGGGALVVRGVVERPTQDLDFFATAPDSVDRLRPVLERALRDQGLTVEMRRAVPGFAQYRVSDASEGTAVDLSWDTRLHPAEPTAFGLVLSRDELAADKTLALFGRAEARDFVDVYRLRRFYSRDDLYRFAREKDRGFDLAMFGVAVARIDRHERRDFPVDDASYAAMRDEFADWRKSLTVELEQGLDAPRLGRDLEPPGHDLGL